MNAIGSSILAILKRVVWQIMRYWRSVHSCQSTNWLYEGTSKDGYYWKGKDSSQHSRPTSDVSLAAVKQAD